MKKTVKDLRVLSIMQSWFLRNYMQTLIKNGVTELPNSLEELLEVGEDVLLPMSHNTMDVAAQVMAGARGGQYIRDDIVTASGRKISEVMRDTEPKDHLATIYELTKDISNEEALDSFRKPFDEAKAKLEEIRKRDEDTAAKNKAAALARYKSAVASEAKEVRNSIDGDELDKFEKLVEKLGEDIVLKVTNIARRYADLGTDGRVSDNAVSIHYGTAIEELYDKEFSMNDSVQRGFGKNKQIDETISYIVKANRFI
jgi:NTP pyrophosphatase (non-canonical NTP hydrolase)